MRPVAYDLFCCAGGAAKGLWDAGFIVRGFDIEQQPNYPFRFSCEDALEADLSGASFVWASPPCQKYTALKTMPNAKVHKDLIPATREKLRKWGGPYIIENVPGAPLINPVMLCGSMFGLCCKEAELRRHRLFESNVPLLTPICQHGKKPRVIGVYGNGGGALKTDIAQAGKSGIAQRMFSKKKDQRRWV